jgi:hypothetical protein
VRPELFGLSLSELVIIAAVLALAALVAGGLLLLVLTIRR